MFIEKMRFENVIAFQWNFFANVNFESALKVKKKLNLFLQQILNVFIATTAGSPKATFFDKSKAVLTTSRVSFPSEDAFTLYDDMMSIIIIILIRTFMAK